MSAPADRRGFLRGLTTLPLIGGSVALIGAPKAVAEPITDHLLWSYKEWLFYEHRMLSYELAGYDQQIARDLERYVVLNSGCDWHFRFPVAEGSRLAGWPEAPQPSTRAALVLSAVGCDWRRS